MDTVTVRREAVAGDVERGPRSPLWPAESPTFRKNIKQRLDHASLLLKGDWLHCRSGIGRAIQHIRHHRVPRVSDGWAVQAGWLDDGSQERCVIVADVDNGGCRRDGGCQRERPVR